MCTCNLCIVCRKLIIRILQSVKVTPQSCNANDIQSDSRRNSVYLNHTTPLRPDGGPLKLSRKRLCQLFRLVPKHGNQVLDILAVKCRCYKLSLYPMSLTLDNHKTVS